MSHVGDRLINFNECRDKLVLEHLTNKTEMDYVLQSLQNNFQWLLDLDLSELEEWIERSLDTLKKLDSDDHENSFNSSLDLQGIPYEKSNINNYLIDLMKSFVFDN